MNKTNIIQILKEEKSFYKTQFHVDKLGLFGSFAKDEQTEDSDVDVLFELDDTPISDLYDNKEAFRNYLEDKFQRKVDMCRIKFIKPFLKEYILKDAIFI